MEELLPGTPYRPDETYDNPDLLGEILTARVLPLVSRPARYIGGAFGAAREAWERERANILLAFPDAYEIGMSHTGLRILYDLLNRHSCAFADLTFTPWPDMEERLRSERMPLFGLESRRPARQFDVVGFSLCYELCYTNLLTMLDLAGLPVLASQRDDGAPVVIAGGACVLNPSVVAPFCDLLFLGDGEEAVLEMADIVFDWKRAGGTRAELISRLGDLPGVWRPGGEAVRSRVLSDLNRVGPPRELVPIIEPVHDRLTLEVMRGCARGCRFCQAGMITRPVRERDVALLVTAAEQGIARSGWDEISLLSLSTSDYSGLAAVVSGLAAASIGDFTNLVLPSLRVDSLAAGLYGQVSREAPANFTFAPEAGSQRLRDVINKQITAAEVLTGTERAFAAGAKGVKLYFMIGLPTETEDDLDAIVDLVREVVALAPRGGGQVTVSISPFAPKPHTPFQWAGQIPAQEIARRNGYLAQRLRKLRVKVSLRDPAVSRLEALLGIGDKRLAEVVLRAWLRGARFDGWTEQFAADIWDDALADAGVDVTDYLETRDTSATLPWDDVVAAVDRDFLAEDWQRSRAGELLDDCRLSGECYDCAACEGELDHLWATLPEAEAAGKPTAATGGGPGAEEEIVVFDPRNASRQDPARERRRWKIWRRQAAAKCWYRVEYEKQGDLRFLGHLDFQRQLRLALRRARLPVAYSQGYHPHALLKFGPPLPVGVSGRCELLDVAFRGETSGWERTLNRTLPPGLRILRSVVIGATVPRSIDQGIERLDYRIELPPPSAQGPARSEVVACCERFLASEHWPYARRRPKGDVEVDARALVPDGGLTVVTTAGPGTILQISLLQDAGGASLPVHDFLAAVCGDLLPAPQLCWIQRTGCYGLTTDGRWQTPFEEVGVHGRRFWLRRKIQA